MSRILHTHKALISSLALILLMLAARMIWHSSFHFAFLLWNIFLAIVPLCFSHYVSTGKRPVLVWASAALWLLFFPNAAYLLTDIVHLRVRESPDFWLDLVVLFSAGMWGIVAGLHSLQIMEEWYGRFLPGRARQLVTLAVLLASGYGIYLGRVERWNSWDIVCNTGDLFSAIAYQVRHPFRCIEVWGLSFLFALCLGLSYLILPNRKTQA